MLDSISNICIKGFEWPAELKKYIDLFSSIESVINLARLKKNLSNYNKNEDIIISFLTKEYIGIGQKWILQMNKLGITQYLIFAIDKETEQWLSAMNISFFGLSQSESIYGSSSYITKDDFSAKGLFTITIKNPITMKMLEMGYNVVVMDIDALFLRKPHYDQFEGADFCFQRVTYFPNRIAEIWGFTACAGFVRFESNQKTIRFLSTVMTVQHYVNSDQIALNVALWLNGAKWQRNKVTPGLNLQIIDDRKKDFCYNANEVINGSDTATGCLLRALPADTFWRNDAVPFNSQKVILYHPNSPKSDLGKLAVFKAAGII